jgi:hypothetical protein
MAAGIFGCRRFLFFEGACVPRLTPRYPKGETEQRYVLLSRLLVSGIMPVRAEVALRAPFVKNKTVNCLFE